MVGEAERRCIDWRVSDRAIDYAPAVAEMEARVAAIRAGAAPELVWLLEHPSLYTAGTSAKEGDLLAPDRFPAHRTGRGGQYTYHGPGQRVGYVMLDLEQRGRDVRRHVHDLEEWLIRTLAAFGVKGERRSGRVGIWVARGAGREDKIAAIGVRVRRWVTYHGVSLNLVYTPPELRRRGYGTACVAAFSQHLLDAGATFCALFADLSNPASNGLYLKIGYRGIGDFEQYAFAPAS